MVEGVEVGSVLRLVRIAGLIFAVAAGLAYVAATQFASGPAATSDELAVRPPGARLFKRWCSDCHHTVTGPGSMALARKYQGTLPPLLEQRTDTTPDFIKFFVRNGSSFMPPFRKTEITDAGLDQLALYLTQAGKRAPASAARGE